MVCFPSAFATFCDCIIHYECVVMVWLRSCRNITDFIRGKFDRNITMCFVLVSGSIFLKQRFIFRNDR